MMITGNNKMAEKQIYEGWASDTNTKHFKVFTW